MIRALPLVLAAAMARAQGGWTNVYTVGRVACSLPPALTASVAVYDGVGLLAVRPRAGLDLDVADYDWRAEVAHGLTAGKYVRATLDPDAYEDFRLVEPERTLSLQGYPARGFAFTHRVRDPHARGRSLEVEERYLVVRRRWGFVVLRHVDAAALFDDGRPDFNLLLRGLRLLPEPPGSPRLLLAGVVLAALLAGAAVLFLLSRTRRK